MKNIIEQIQDDDPSYDPLKQALSKVPFVGMKQWVAACDRVYMDGYYGPLNDEEWKEQDGREPSNVGDAIRLIAKVLDKVDDYGEYYDEFYVESREIKAALVPWYREIYGVRFPS